MLGQGAQARVTLPFERALENLRPFSRRAALSRINVGLKGTLPRLLGCMQIASPHPIDTFDNFHWARGRLFFSGLF